MATRPSPAPTPAAGPPLDLSLSVAGEEDPGASIDLALPAGRGDSPTRAGPLPSAVQPPLNPGDEVPAGSPGSGEDVCPRCGGSGRLGPLVCGHCAGSGKVTVGIGGG